MPLPRQAVRLVQEMPRFVGTDLVFPSDAGTSVSGFSKAKAALERKVAEMRATRGAEPMAPWHVHDFRRALSTWMH